MENITKALEQVKAADTMQEQALDSIANELNNILGKLRDAGVRIKDGNDTEMYLDSVSSEDGALLFDCDCDY
jgi:hypothetical protein